MESNYIIFGAGKRGCVCLEYLLQKGRNVLFFIDNSPEKQGTEVAGVPVYSPDKLLYESRSFTIVITVKNHEEEIKWQLLEMGVGLKRTCMTLSDLESNDLREIYDDMKNVYRKNLSHHIASPSIIYDHQIFSLQERGGISRYCHEIITEIVKKNKVCVDLFKGISTNNACFDNENSLFNSYFEVEDEFVLNPYHKLMLNNALIGDFSRGITYDICHPTYYHLPNYLHYKKLVITVHDLIEEKTGLFPEMAELKKKIINVADGIIAVSDNTKRDLQEIYGVADEKIRVIYEANSFKCEGPLNRPCSEKYILYVGDRKHYKNWDGLANAFAKAKISKNLHMVCFGGGEFSKEEKELIVELELTDRISQVGGDDKQLAAYYQHAKAFVYPSKYEGFGLPVLEAMYFGAPVLAANRTSLPEVGGEAAYYFDPDSVDSMSEALDKVLLDSELLEVMRERGKVQERKFSWDKAAKETLDFYFEILGR